MLYLNGVIFIFIQNLQVVIEISRYDLATIYREMNIN